MQRQRTAASAPRRSRRRTRETVEKREAYGRGNPGGRHYQDLPDGDPDLGAGYREERPEPVRTEEERPHSTRTRPRPRRVMLTPEEQQRGQAAKDGARNRSKGWEPKVRPKAYNSRIEEWPPTAGGMPKDGLAHRAGDQAGRHDQPSN